MSDDRSTAGAATENMQRTGEAMRATGERMAENGSTVGAKILDQAEENVREAFAAMRAATQAKDLSEVMKIQGDYMRDQGSRAMAQAREIGEMIVQFGKDTTDTMRGGFKG
ncbi:phasin family protein [Sphingomonas floccifaciens]|uniref:Phasin family protein n=1 Tax=Sphingomonas floccifaciens TaxID=1844115 RepID=A0ABW4N952_9SPHN